MTGTAQDAPLEVVGPAADFALLGGERPLLDRSRNASFYLLDDDLVAVVPFRDAFDGAESSLESIAIQEAYFKRRGVRGGSVIFMDRVLEQDRAARQNYKVVPDPKLISGFGLVTESVFGRAISSLFLGLSATRVPTRVFPNLAQAALWLKTQTSIRSARS